MNQISQTFDSTQISKRLSYEFREKTKKLGNKNEKGTKLYELQVEFSHILNEIQRGPSFFIPKLLSDYQNLIKKIG
ncbi:MAG: hypothetical protein KDH96_02595 [Candidatus Riesia sp.]|nr:hypothetical protein [Candidatus Riesia sp.]